MVHVEVIVLKVAGVWAGVLFLVLSLCNAAQAADRVIGTVALRSHGRSVAGTWSPASDRRSEVCASAKAIPMLTTACARMQRRGSPKAYWYHAWSGSLGLVAAMAIEQSRAASRRTGLVNVAADATNAKLQAAASWVPANTELGWCALPAPSGAPTEPAANYRR